MSELPRVDIGQAAVEIEAAALEHMDGTPHVVADMLRALRSALTDAALYHDTYRAEMLALVKSQTAELQQARDALTASERQPNSIRFGLYTITETSDPGKVHVFHDSGEGGEFDKTRLGLVLAGYFAENF